MAFFYKGFFLAGLIAQSICAKSGFSYNRFTGPVSGPIKEIQVQPAYGIAEQQHADYGYDHKLGRIHPDTAKYAHLKTVDYTAKPDYQYSYGVNDPYTGNQQDHKESRDGDVVTGEYSLVEPNGDVRIVKYTADPVNGFQATVIKQGQDNNQNDNAFYGNTDDGEEESTEY